MLSLNIGYAKVKKFISTPEGFFLFVGLGFGLLFIVAVPPFQTPDANVHFYRAYEVSELKTPQVGPTSEGGSYLPASIRQTETGVYGVVGPPKSPMQLAFNPDQKYDQHQTKAALSIDLDENNKIFYVTSGAPNYVPLNYFPQALVVAGGRLLNAPIIIMLYIVSVVNLFIWIGLAYVGIKIFPWKKWTLVFICLLPMMVLQSTSPGLDGQLYGLTLVFISIIMRYVSERELKIGYKGMLTLILVATLMVFGKSVLGLFLPFIFLLKNSQISIPRPRLAKILVFLLPILLFVIWAIISRTTASPSDSINGASQMAIFIHSPWIFFLQMVNTLLLNIPEGYILINSLIGYFGWLDTPLPSIVMVFGYVMLAFALVVNYERPNTFKEISRRYRLILLLGGVSYVGAVFLSMYIFFTTPSGNFLRGVQGRYLIPLLFVATPLLFTDSLRIKKSKYVKLIKVSSLTLLLVSIVTIVIRYYVVFVPAI